MKIFISYCREDEVFKNKLEAHLASLERAEKIETWTDRKIVPGQPWDSEINKSLDDSDIIILLVSADFINSDYCYDVEVKKAVHYHKSQEKTLVPVIVRYCDWNDTPFSDIQALPTDAVPISSNQWNTDDEAYLDVVQGIKRLLPNLIKVVDDNYESNTNKDTTAKKSPIGKLLKFCIWLAIGITIYVIFLQDSWIMINNSNLNINSRSIGTSDIFYSLLFGAPAMLFLIGLMVLPFGKAEKWEAILYSITSSIFLFILIQLILFLFTFSISYLLPLILSAVLGVLIFYLFQKYR